MRSTYHVLGLSGKLLRKKGASLVFMAFGLVV
jgi:hypothetical protein